LIEQFGSQRITDEILDLLNQVLDKRGIENKDKYLNYFNRGIFFSHRDFDKVLKKYLSGSEFYLYTGRGPSSESMHIGHLVPFRMTQLLQELFDVYVVIQLTDDEKFYYNDGTLEGFTQMGYENIKDIIATGFNPEKTFIFTNTGYIHHLYPFVVKMNKLINYNQIKGIFGVDESSSIGKISFPTIQAAPCFSGCFPHLFKDGKIVPCLVPCAIDQDPYFRMTRDVSNRLKYPKPALLHARFLPSLKGLTAKMSSSIPDSVIFLTDGNKAIKKKIGRSFSGGGDTLEEHRKNGGNLDVDVAYHYLVFFLDNDEELNTIADGYKNGTITTGEVKKRIIEIIQSIIQTHKSNREKIDDDVIKNFMNY
jgi:tryptophanyl-tRNA synthetase